MEESNFLNAFKIFLREISALAVLYVSLWS